MELKDFSRPIGDTGIGVDWSPGFPAAIGIQRIESRWIPLLRGMGVSWVRFSHSGGLEFAGVLLRHNIMPIVQFRRPRALPDGLTLEEQTQIKAYAAAGVRYFELAGDLDAPQSWQHGHPERTALPVLASQLLRDIEYVLKVGGLPGLPAADEPAWQNALLGALCQNVGPALGQVGLWQAWHIRAENLPLDFPEDPVTQTGRSLSEEEYRRGEGELWEGAAWHGRSRSEINAERQRRRQAGASRQKTALGWRRYEALDATLRRFFGRSVPILGTSGGCSVGDCLDPRFPAVSPAAHSARLREMARNLMGTSTRYEAAPGYLFCAAFSLLGNYALGHFEPAWESQAWISPRWPGGRLPIVDTLRQEPKRARWSDQALPEPTGGISTPVSLPASGGFSESDRLPDAIRVISDLVAPSVGRPLSELLQPKEADEPAERPAEAAPFAFGAAATLAGRLARGAGRTVSLIAAGSTQRITETVAGNDLFVFRNLRPGAYRLTVEQTPLPPQELTLSAGQEGAISLSMPEWSWQIQTEQRDLGFSIVRCSVEGRSGVAVRISCAGWEGLMRPTGSKPEYGPFACELAPLAAGHYILEPAGLGVRVELDLDGRSVVQIDFVRTKTEPAKVELPTLPRSKALHTYLFLARPFASKEDLFAVLGFMRAQQAVCGFSVEEARWAKDVLIVGQGALRVTEQDERLLRESGCRVRRVNFDIAATLIRLAQMGDPFVEQTAHA